MTSPPAPLHMERGDPGMNMLLECTVSLMIFSVCSSCDVYVSNSPSPCGEGVRG